MSHQVYADKQRGSVASFLVVGLVLVGLVLGSVYALRHQNSSQQTGSKIASSETNKVAVSVNNESGKKSSTNKTPAETPKSDTSKSANSSAQYQSAGAKSTQANVLPQTGPADNLASIAALTILAGSVGYYIQSRLQLAKSRL